MPASSTKSQVTLIEGDLLNLETRVLQVQERLKPDSNLYGFLDTLRQQCVSKRYQLSVEAEQHINDELREDQRRREKNAQDLGKILDGLASAKTQSDVSFTATPTEKPKA